ncbi:MAG: glycosyltransferase family 9 protein [Dysgonamonadaceae bacterium]|jgi:ADP-heptose:LPS heptosyltransferase|nr:glycosyltransferase family 9 protein [Dysgonamonadaceae bacterium]
MARTLAIRLSSLGDVAMAIPVVYSVANRYPVDEFILLTKKPLLPLFINKPPNLEIFPIHTKGKYKGITGIWKLIRKLDKRGIDQIADLHQVLRSIGIDWYFRLKGKKIAVIDKDKKDKKALTRRKKKKVTPLKSSFERYQRVFEELGYNASLNFVSLFATKDKREETRIGIAPFAKHQCKIYPFEKMEEVVRLLNENLSTKIFLFGGKEEYRSLENLAKKYERVEAIAGHLTFFEELLIMNSLDIMLSMDSANMHLASLVNIPVVSIWGATHPYAGFYGYNQDLGNAIQLDMDCRPCSVFGNKSCWRGNFSCMRDITPEQIVEKIMINLR